MAKFGLICNPQRKYNQNEYSRYTFHTLSQSASMRNSWWNITWHTAIRHACGPSAHMDIWWWQLLLSSGKSPTVWEWEVLPEMWVRVVIRAIRNPKLYLSNDYLRSGLPSWFSHVHPTESYCSYSEQYQQGMDEENKDEVRAVYEDEIYALRLNSTWTGIWQMHKMANVPQQPFICIYSEIGLLSLRCDFNQIFLPEDKKLWLWR